MTDIDITRMAKEAGGDDWGIFRDFMPEIERFAALVAAAEREACAQIAYDYTVKVSLPNFFESAEYVAAAIRARGQE
jgi:hypothetical protein